MLGVGKRKSPSGMRGFVKHIGVDSFAFPYGKSPLSPAVPGTPCSKGCTILSRLLRPSLINPTRIGERPLPLGLHPCSTGNQGRVFEVFNVIPLYFLPRSLYLLEFHRVKKWSFFFCPLPYMLPKPGHSVLCLSHCCTSLVLLLKSLRLQYNYKIVACQEHDILLMKI